jgi:Tfp pilus assembly protein FimT
LLRVGDEEKNMDASTRVLIIVGIIASGIFGLMYYASSVYERQREDAKAKELATTLALAKQEAEEREKNREVGEERTDKDRAARLEIERIRQKSAVSKRDDTAKIAAAREKALAEQVLAEKKLSDARAAEEMRIKEELEAREKAHAYEVSQDRERRIKELKERISKAAYDMRSADERRSKLETAVRALTVRVAGGQKEVERIDGDILRLEAEVKRPQKTGNSGTTFVQDNTSLIKVAKAKRISAQSELEKDSVLLQANRNELAEILRSHADAIADSVGAELALKDYGETASVNKPKTATLLATYTLTDGRVIKCANVQKVGGGDILIKDLDGKFHNIKEGEVKQVLEPSGAAKP